MAWRSEGWALGELRGRVDLPPWPASLSPAPSAFRQAVLAHIDAAYNLARWLVGGEHEAEEVVCEALMQALASPRALDGDDADCWVLQTVHGVVYARLGIESARPQGPERVEPDPAPLAISPALFGAVNAPRRMDTLLEQLPIELRECLVLRELHRAGYRQIAAIAGIEVDDVRRRLWLGRQLLVRLAAYKIADSGASRE